MLEMTFWFTGGGEWEKERKVEGVAAKLTHVFAGMIKETAVRFFCHFIFSIIQKGHTVQKVS